MTPSITSRVVCRVRVAGGPLCENLETYRARAEQLGYKPDQIRFRLRHIAKLDLWLVRKKVSLRDLDEETVAAFLAQLRRRQPRNVRGAELLCDSCCGCCVKAEWSHRD